MDHAPPEVARRNLADLVRINRYFGGHSVLKQMMSRVARPDETFTVLDIGAASGDTARTLQSSWPGATVINLDYNWVNLGGAPAPKVLGDAFALPFPPNSFDFVVSSLFLHHFQNNQVVQLLKSFYAIARRGLCVADLERSIFPYIFLPLTQPLFGWDHLTVRDGVVSVRAAFRRKELTELARLAGITSPEVRIHRPAFRISLIGRK